METFYVFVALRRKTASLLLKPLTIFTLLYARNGIRMRCKEISSTEYYCVCIRIVINYCQFGDDIALQIQFNEKLTASNRTEWMFHIFCSVNFIRFRYLDALLLIWKLDLLLSESELKCSIGQLKHAFWLAFEYVTIS